MDAWQMVIQQLEGLITEIEALSEFLEVLDEDYVGAEPAGDRSMRTILQEIRNADQSLLHLANFENKQSAADEDHDFSALLTSVKVARLELVERLKEVQDPERAVNIEGKKTTNLMEIAKMIAVANAGDLREIAYRLHGSQKIFSKR